jgi:Family of unknown function (DUF6464)
MKFNRKSFIAIASAAARVLGISASKKRLRDGEVASPAQLQIGDSSETIHCGKPFDKLNRKHLFGGLVLGIFVLLCLRSRALRLVALFVLSILLAGIVGGAIGTIVGSVLLLLLGIGATIWMWLQRLVTTVTATWQPKDPDSEFFLHDRATSAFSRTRSVRSQLRIAASQPRAERLQTIARLQASIRSRLPNLSIQDLQDLNFLGRELHQIIDEESWSSVRRSRVDRIAEIRNSRRNRGQNIPSGLSEADDEDSEFIVTYSDLLRYGALDDDDPDGIGDLSCEYNARSLFLRCAVHPGAETCEGCRDYRSRDLAEPDARS